MLSPSSKMNGGHLTLYLVNLLYYINSKLCKYYAKCKFLDIELKKKRIFFFIIIMSHISHIDT